MRAAVTGHLVLSTMHTNDAASAAARLVDMGAPPYMVGMALQIVIAQRLVRRVCLHCSDTHVPTVAQRAWLDTQLGRGAWDVTGLKRGRGCTRCRQTGFEGRHGLYEVLGMDADMIGALMRGDMAGFNTAAQRALAGQSLATGAAQAAASGVTTVEEAMRIGLRNLPEAAAPATTAPGAARPTPTPLAGAGPLPGLRSLADTGLRA